MPAVVSDVVADLVAAADKARADDRLITSPEVQLCEIEALFDVVTTTQALLVRRLRTAWDAEATKEVTGRATKAWLHEELLVPNVEAGKLLGLAHQLPAHPLTQTAFDAAEIGLAHAVAIGAALRTLPVELRDTVEPHLIERARFYPPEEIAGFCDELLEALGIDKASDLARERRHGQRGIDLTRTLAGSRAITGTLTPEVAEELEKALALAAGASSFAEEDPRSTSQRQHDALGVIAAAYLATKGVPSFNGSPRTVIITMDLELLENRLREAWLTLPSGATISAATARRLCCDAKLVPMVLGGASEILDVAEAGSEFSVAVRRAAYERDGGRCAFPDCRNPVAELHHMVFRRHGGPGTLANAAWLCNYHHWLVHEGGWTLQRLSDNNYLWTGPHGQQRVRHLKTARQPSTA
jgi:hypothetical protein